MLGQLLADELTKINPKFKESISMKRWPEVFDGGTVITSMTCENGPDPYHLTNLFHSEYGYASYFGYGNEEIDKYLEAAQWSHEP